MGNLTALKVKAIKTPGRYSDGNGLMLVCKASGAKSWIFRIQYQGRRRDFGLGSFKDVTLSEAREKALEARKLVREGKDPSAAKSDSQRNLGHPTTFEGVARSYFEERKADWQNPKHRSQWITTLETYAFPSLGALPIDDISSRDIRDALAPIWRGKTETARRVLQRIAAVLDYAHSIELRQNEAPTRSVRAGLGKQRAKTKHHVSLPYPEMPSLMERLRAKDGMGSHALRLAIYTASRSGEVRHARWSEIDWKRQVWVRPAERMKMRVEHTVPLSTHALELLKGLKQGMLNESGLIFPSARNRPLSDMTLLKAIRAVSEDKITVHGCRTSFRVWAAEKTSFPAPAAEAALAHSIQNKGEAAYHRTDYLEIRRSMMEEWAKFLHR